MRVTPEKISVLQPKSAWSIQCRLTGVVFITCVPCLLRVLTGTSSVDKNLAKCGVANGANWSKRYVFAVRWLEAEFRSTKRSRNRGIINNLKTKFKRNSACTAQEIKSFDCTRTSCDRRQAGWRCTTYKEPTMILGMQCDRCNLRHEALGRKYAYSVTPVRRLWRNC